MTGKEIVVKKPLFNVAIPEPTKEDVEWAAKLKKKTFFKGIKWQMIVSLHSGNLWRVNHLATTYPKKIDFKKSQRDYDFAPFITDAFSQNNEQVVKYMLDQCMDYGSRTQNLRILNDAMSSRKPLHLEALLTAFDESYRTASLMRSALVNGYENMVLTLLNYGYDVNDAEIKPLMVAIEYDKLNVVKALIDAGADIKTEAEMLVLEAERLGHHAVAKYLEQQINIQRPASTEEIWEKISDQEIIYTRTSENNKYTITDLFNYADQSVTRTQYKNDLSFPPVMSVQNFDALRNEDQILTKAFNKLVEKDGKPTAFLGNKKGRVQKLIQLAPAKSDR